MQHTFFSCSSFSNAGFMFFTVFSGKLSKTWRMWAIVNIYELTRSCLIEDRILIDQMTGLRCRHKACLEVFMETIWLEVIIVESKWVLHNYIARVCSKPVADCWTQVNLYIYLWLTSSVICWIRTHYLSRFTKFRDAIAKVFGLVLHNILEIENWASGEQTAQGTSP